MFDDTFSRFDTIHERDERTDGQTEGQTDTGKKSYTVCVRRNRRRANTCTLIGNWKCANRPTTQRGMATSVQTGCTCKTQAYYR